MHYLVTVILLMMVQSIYVTEQQTHENGKLMLTGTTTRTDDNFREQTSTEDSPLLNATTTKTTTSPTTFSTSKPNITSQTVDNFLRNTSTRTTDSTPSHTEKVPFESTSGTPLLPALTSETTGEANVAFNSTEFVSTGSANTSPTLSKYFTHTSYSTEHLSSGTAERTTDIHPISDYDSSSNTSSSSTIEYFSSTDEASSTLGTTTVETPFSSDDAIVDASSTSFILTTVSEGQASVSSVSGQPTTTTTDHKLNMTLYVQQLSNESTSQTIVVVYRLNNTHLCPNKTLTASVCTIPDCSEKVSGTKIIDLKTTEGKTSFDALSDGANYWLVFVTNCLHFQADAKSVSTGPRPPDNTVLILVIICVLALLAGACFALLFVIRQHPELLNLTHSSVQDGILTIALQPVRTKPIEACAFLSHVMSITEDCGLQLTEEFEDLKLVGRELSTEQAQLQCNRVKNRFTNILPYDISRVKLIPMDDIDGSDYVNANWIPGYNAKREYIATQGPLPSTKDDFWRTVWEYNCRAIVMLTLCTENYRIKCEQYWPMDSEPLFYGDLQISIAGETKSKSCHIRDLQISLGEELRNIRHFHYVEWPDMKVPDTRMMLGFVRKVRAHIDSKTGGPLIVHCSAGVGRTGTFIALDVLLQQLAFQNVLDVFGVVYRMRMSRVLMVQTEQQYAFIYECLKYAITETQKTQETENKGEANEVEEEEEMTDTESVLHDHSLCNAHS